MKGYITTNGCPENRIDCAKIEVFLVNNGWTITTNIIEADLIIFNSCGLTKGTEDQSVKIIQLLNRKKRKDTKLILTGCLHHINRDRVEKNFQGDIFEYNDLDRLSDLLKIQIPSKDLPANYLIPERVTMLGVGMKDYLSKLLHFNIYSFLTKVNRKKYKQIWDSVSIVQPNTFYVKVCSGCSKSCSYCAVKLSRGATKSKPINKIKNEVIAGLEAGFKDFALIGTDLGSYGVDRQCDLIELLRELNSIDADFHIKLRNVHPKLYIDNLPRFLDVLKPGKINFMTSAVQSGNNRILNEMHRGYKIEDFIFAINSVKSAFPNFVIRTQIMVGFPGESDAEFQDTVQLLDKVQFNFIEVYNYSPRPGTLAATKLNQIPHLKAKKREFLLKKVVMKSMSS
ncbi:radical SAM protein [Desulfosediminicola flagellatus]|uniref:radical SAM protein n=1 Tax=Desulfosediminicola flagellatus TaxID=2569541 RepID=UPI0010ABE23F|nr:radical SAM protein [Desulfosediminicola flagellatus]